MPLIDWTSQGIALALAVAGVFLIVLNLTIRYLSASWALQRVRDRRVECVARLSLFSGGMRCIRLDCAVSGECVVKPGRRGKFLFRDFGFIGGLALVSAGGLHFLLPNFLVPTPEKSFGDAQWYTVDRGDVTGIMVASGEVEAADITRVAVTLHASSPGLAAGMIRWVIDKGKMVKKGDLLVELDDSEWRRQLTEQPMAPARRKFVEEQIANCRMLAPRDGLAVYYIEERRRSGGPWPTATVGELVKEGQRLLSIYDLSKMLVKTRISQSRIAHVRLGQPARVHVDHFPDRTFLGQVSRIRAEPGLNQTYVWVTLSDPVVGLQPDMSAQVHLEVGQRENVLRVATDALALIPGEEKANCLVKSGRNLETRAVTVELGDSQFVEVSDGLKEGEQVLRVPVGAKER